MTRALAFVLAIALAGCAAVEPRRDAAPGLAHFETLATDSRVRYEPGAAAYAQRVADLLPAAIAQTEAAHYLPFAAPVVVHVCGTAECFTRALPGGGGYTAAVLFENRLLLAPRLFDREPARLYPILVHELSHLHLGQRLGHYTMTIPVWFHEGLASLAAESGGADLVTEAAALEAIAAGAHFLPDAAHDVTRRRYADHWQLRLSMLYRQSMMLLEALRAANEAHFRTLLVSLQEQVAFDDAMQAAYGAGALELAQQYFDRVRCRIQQACSAPAAAP